MASSSTRDLIEGSHLTCFLMLGGEIMEAMTWASTSTYEGNRKFQDGLSYKSSIEKQIRPMGASDGNPLQKYKRWQLGKIERNPKQQIWKKDKKINLLTIQVPFRPLWRWGVFIIQLYNVVFSHRVGNFNKCCNTSSNTSMSGSKARIWR